MLSLEERFHEVWRRISAKTDPEAVYTEILKHYLEEGRFYHTHIHIGESLDLLDEVTGKQFDKTAVKLALWFHDVILNNHSKVNEEMSMTYALDRLNAAMVDPYWVAITGQLIMATKHPVANLDLLPSEMLIADIDLGILGKPYGRYLTYSYDIRKEYAWVSDEDYRKGRVSFLQNLCQERIYKTDFFYEKLEQQARENIAKEITRLSS